jgi:RNA polymerase sigma factor (sigma-70 family)
MKSDSRYSELSDEALVILSLRGQRKAWEALVRRYERLIRAVARRTGLSEPDCANVFHATCVRLLVSLERLRGRRSLASWLVKTVDGECERLRNRFARTTEELDIRELVSPPSKTVLRTALDTLPPRCRRVVQHSYFNRSGRNTKEIAQDLGLSDGRYEEFRTRCAEKLRRTLNRLTVDA